MGAAGVYADAGSKGAPPMTPARACLSASSAASIEKPVSLLAAPLSIRKPCTGVASFGVVFDAWPTATKAALALPLASGAPTITSKIASALCHRRARPSCRCN